jgi:hypothetical protein
MLILSESCNIEKVIDNESNIDFEIGSEKENLEILGKN